MTKAFFANSLFTAVCDILLVSKKGRKLPMNKSDSLWRNWKEMVYCMEMELQAQAELIDAQKGQIHSLEIGRAHV